ncbi:MAG: hypothetical protein WCC48_11500 [Anaeromyxobacteraceae bacterium]
MSLHTALAVAAFAASIILFLAHASRGLVVVALVASGLEVLMAFGLLALHVAASVPLQLVLGALIAIPAVLIWLRVSTKTAVSAAAVLTLVGLLQVWLSLFR